MACAAPSRAEILSLFRSLLRASRHFSDYNIKDYTWRRAADGFRHNRRLSEPPAVAAAFSAGKSQLEVARRQAVVYHLYSPKMKSIMDVDAA